MARNDPLINARVDANLKAKLQRAARENGRSFAAEVTARLEESFEFSDAIKWEAVRRLDGMRAPTYTPEAAARVPAPVDRQTAQWRSDIDEKLELLLDAVRKLQGR